MSARHLYEFRPAPFGALPNPPSRIVLVVAGCEADASAAIRRALGPALGPRPPIGRLALNDLGPHDGPEEAGAVFVDGYRVVS